MGGPSTFRLGDWRVEPAANLLTRDEDEVRLELKVMEVLLRLAERPGEVVSKRELIDAVWQTEFIAENTLTSAIAGLRQALGDDARDPTYIQTIPKRGYKLLAEVEWERPRPNVAGSSIEAAPPPAFLTDEDIDEPDRPVFVARDNELSKLDGLLEAVLGGRGTVAFVTGEAGAGKTALLGEFSRRAQERIENLVVASGACNAATGAGDPYGPWRQILAQLAGDVEGRVARGVLSIEAGRRLWERVPVFAEAVSNSGGDLAGTLIPGAGLVSRAAAGAPDTPWLADLNSLVERKAAEPSDVTLQQGAIFIQVGRVLRAMAAKAPLLLILDDLHWADAATIDLLCDLGRQLEGSRLLIVGSYRPEDVAVGRGGEAHPLTPVAAELQRVHGDAAIAVGATGEKHFVDALIDTETNRLDESFHEELLSHTYGHALFTVELLRTLQQRGLLSRDDEGMWVAGDDLDWSTLPARVEGVIAARIERLSENLRELLTIAAVEGADFTAEVLSRVREIETREIIKDLSSGLERQHRLVTARGIRAMTEGRLSLYGFSHVLFQSYVYNNLDHVERAQLHEEVGNVLEALYGDEVAEIAPQLARHFEEAGQIDRAVHYLGLAADGAGAVCAFKEAEAHNRKALFLLESIPPSEDRAAVRIERLQALAMIVASARGWAHSGVGELASELREQCREAGDAGHLFWALWLALAYHGNRGELRQLLPLADEILGMAEASGEPMLLVTAHQLHLYLIFAGDFRRAREHLEMGLDLLDDSSAVQFRAVVGLDPRTALLQWLALALLFLGWRDRAFATAREAVAVADKTDHPFTKAFVRGVLANGISSHDPEMGRQLADECIAIAEERGFEELRGYGLTARAWAAAALGDPEPNEQAIAWLESSDFVIPLTWCLSVRCKFLLADGKAKEASAETARVLELIETRGQRDIKSVVHRLAGDAAAMVGDEDGAENAYLRAIEVAKSQQAKPFELEAATALARLWQSQGKTTEARDLLQPVYNWFTEGLDTQPLVEARELLGEFEPTT